MEVAPRKKVRSAGPAKALQKDLAEFRREADTFARAANQLVERSVRLARNPMERAKVLQMIDRAKMLQRGVMMARDSLGDVKTFVNEIAGVDVTQNKLFIESSDTVIRGVTKALKWFNSDAQEIAARLEAGTLAQSGPLTPAAVLTLGAGLWFAAKKTGLIPKGVL